MSLEPDIGEENHFSNFKRVNSISAKEDSDENKGKSFSLSIEEEPFFQIGHDDIIPPVSAEEPLLKPKRRIQFDIGAIQDHPRSSDGEETPGVEPTRIEGKDNLMVELYDLHGLNEWVETARWIKYEQDVEGINHHWSLPHVGFLFFDSVFALEKSLKKAVILESHEQTWSSLIDDIAEKLTRIWGHEEADVVAALMRLRQTHVQNKSLIKSVTSAKLRQLTSSRYMSSVAMSNPILRGNPTSLPEDVAKQTMEATLSPKLSVVRRHVNDRKLVKESAQVFAGEIAHFKDNKFVFVKLQTPVFFPEIDESCPVRYFVFILGPPQDVPFHQMGRSFCTMMADQRFRHIAKRATCGSELVKGLKEFLHNAALIAGSKIDSKSLVQRDRLCEELNSRVKIREKQRTIRSKGTIAPSEVAYRPKVKKTSGIFRGFREDFFNRVRDYRSDITDAWDFQCVRTVIYMFLACISATVTFGGLMGEYTHDAMGMSETIIAQCLVGIIWGLFSAQPLIVQSPTGPVLLFEGALYTACAQFNLDFLTVRWYAGIWMFLIFFTAACFDVQRLLKYVTKFTEEIFSALIAMILFKEAIHFLLHTFATNPATDFKIYEKVFENCAGAPIVNTTDALNRCGDVPHPNTALLTLMLFGGTFALAILFHRLKVSQWLGRPQRTWVGDYSVMGALVIILTINQAFFSSIYLEKLGMPSTLGYTNETSRGHGTLVVPVSYELPLTLAVSIMSAALLFILIFVETGITEVVLTRKERMLTKGGGQSWDLVLSGLCCLFCSILGLPWMCAAAVQTIAHSNALTVTEKKAPGEKPEPVRVIEQRMTIIFLSIAIGCFGIVGRFFRFLPMAALFGVFAYLGFTSLLELDFFRRATLFLKPSKYHPKKTYVDEVATLKMHLFTAIQIVLVIIAFLLKFNQYSAILFPFVLCVFVAVRQYILPYMFSQHELLALDEGHEADEASLLDDPGILLV